MTQIFGHSIRQELVSIYALDAALIFMMTFAMMLLLGQADVSAGLTHPIAIALIVAVAAGLVSGAVGLYQPSNLISIRRALPGAVLTAALLLLLTAALLGGADGSLPMILVGGTLGSMALTRIAYAVLHGHSRRIAFIGEAGHARGAALHRQYQPFEVTLSLPAAEKLLQVLERGRTRAWRIWAVVTSVSAPMPAGLRRQCDAAGLVVFTEAEFSEQGLNRLDIESLQPGWLEASKAAHTSPIEAALRRGFDITAASAILLFTLPLLLLSMLVIRLDSPGPIFYRQERLGQGHRPFKLLKLRSMIVDAEPGGTPVWAARKDARVTRVGRFLRLSRIDEIPQVFNVLRGDMSIVGPRPERPAFVNQLCTQIPHYEARAIVKPGITGWAQVNYPYGASVEDARVKLTYDLYYVRRRSLFLDLLILMATVRVVLFQEGAR